MLQKLFLHGFAMALNEISAWMRVGAVGSKVVSTGYLIGNSQLTWPGNRLHS